MNTKKVTVKSIICAVILSLSMPVLSLADSHGKSKDRHSRKKFAKFVNGHDARDGKWDQDNDRDWDRDRDRDRDRDTDRNWRFRFNDGFDRNWWNNDDGRSQRRNLRRSLRFRNLNLFRNR